MRSRLITASLLGSVTLLATASPAQAQLGRLKKMGADAIKKEAGIKEPEAAKSAESSGKKANYTITADRIDLVLASLQPLVADAERAAAAKAVEGDYNAKRKTADACMERAQKMFNPMTMMSNDPQRTARMEAITKQLDGVNKRSQAAMQRDDFRNAIALRDTSMVLMMAQANATIGANCSYPYLPAAMIDAQASAEKNRGARSGDDSDGSGSLDPTPAAKKEMTQQEFGMVRERMALWAMSQSNPSLAKGAKFTPDEEAALGSKAPQVKKLAGLFESNALRWSTWGDVKRW